MALLILIGTMFRTDFRPELERLWPAVLRSLSYISPGLWLFWPSIPRPGYVRAIKQIDDYLYSLIQARRTAGEEPTGDLLGLLVNTPNLSDGLIRDQLYTMLIAGHDTSTALLAWAIYLLGRHEEVLARTRAEVDTVLGQDIPSLDTLGRLNYLEQVINETMRLYPPLHLGVRFAETDLEFKGYHIPAGSRLLYSPYLTHRHPDYWSEPDRFNPDNFSPEQSRHRPAFTFVPFGGGPRICLGAAFAQVEAKVILARILQTFDLTLTEPKVHLHMGVTLEPRPGVMMKVQRRTDRWIQQ
jgi:cytochrome P450